MIMTAVIIMTTTMTKVTPATPIDGRDTNPYDVDDAAQDEYVGQEADTDLH